MEGNVRGRFGGGACGEGGPVQRGGDAAGKGGRGERGGGGLARCGKQS